MDWLVVALFAIIFLCLAVSVIAAFLENAGRDRGALERAEAVVRTHLSEDELSQLHRSGMLQVASPKHAGRVYDIRANGGRVTVRSNGSPEFELCVRTRELLPGREHVVAHKLMIEAAEEEYLRRANVVWRAAHGARQSTTGWWA
jgi:hypothetical protein